MIRTLEDKITIADGNGAGIACSPSEVAVLAEWKRALMRIAAMKDERTRTIALEALGRGDLHVTAFMQGDSK